MMKKLILVLMVLQIYSGKLQAYINFNNGQTHNVVDTINTDVTVDFESPGVETVLNLMAGGNITGYLNAREDSEINVYGEVGNELASFERSQINILGGSITEYVRVYNESRAVISNGWMKSICVYDYSNMVLDGGTVGNDDVAVTGHGTANILSGTINSDVRAIGWAQIDLFGGSIDGYLSASLDSVIRIHGSNFMINGTPIGYGEVSGSFAHLYGNLSNGDLIDCDLYIAHNASILLVPEPTTCLLIFAALPFIKRKKYNNLLSK